MPSRAEMDVPETAPLLNVLYSVRALSGECKESSGVSKAIDILESPMMRPRSSVRHTSPARQPARASPPRQRSATCNARMTNYRRERQHSSRKTAQVLEFSHIPSDDGLGISLNDEEAYLATIESDSSRSLVRRRGVFVESIALGGLAARDGRLQVGDRLLEVNGQSIGRGMSAMQARAILEKEERKGHVILAVGQHGCKHSNVEQFLPKRPTSEHITLSQTPPIVSRRQRRRSLPDIIDSPVRQSPEHRLTNSPVAETDSLTFAADTASVVGDFSEKKSVMRSSSAASLGRKVQSLPSRVHMNAPGVPLALAPSSLGRNGLQKKREVKEYRLEFKPGETLGLEINGGKGSHYGDIGIFITRVEPGSAAERFGHIRRGDEILMVNKKNLLGTSCSEAARLLREAATGNSVDLIVAQSAVAWQVEDVLPVPLQQGKRRVRIPLVSSTDTSQANNTALFGTREQPWAEGVTIKARRLSRKRNSSLSGTESDPNHDESPNLSRKDSFASDSEAKPKAHTRLGRTRSFEHMSRKRVHPLGLDSSSTLRGTNLSASAENMTFADDSNDETAKFQIDHRLQPITSWARLRAKPSPFKRAPKLRETIVLRTTGGLGFTIVGGRGSHKGDLPIYVRRLQPDKAASIDGRLKPGDEIVSVNSQPLSSFSLEEARNLFKDLQRDKRRDLIVLQIQHRLPRTEDVEVTLSKEEAGDMLGVSLTEINMENVKYRILVEAVTKSTSENGFTLLQGDQLLSANNMSFENIGLEEAKNILRNLPVGKVMLQVKRRKMLKPPVAAEKEAFSEPPTPTHTIIRPAENGMNENLTASPLSSPTAHQLCMNESESSPVTCYNLSEESPPTITSCLSAFDKQVDHESPERGWMRPRNDLSAVSDSDESAPSSRVPTPDNYRMASTSLMASLSTFFPEGFFTSSKDNTYTAGLVRTTSTSKPMNDAGLPDDLDVIEQERSLLSSAITDLFAFTDSYTDGSSLVTGSRDDLADIGDCSGKSILEDDVASSDDSTLSLVVTVMKDAGSELGIILNSTEKDMSLVKDVLLASPAHCAGIRSGDRLLEVNGQSVLGHTANEIRQCLKSAGGSIKILLQRTKIQTSSKHPPIATSKSFAPPSLPSRTCYTPSLYREFSQPQLTVTSRSASCDNLHVDLEPKRRSRRGTSAQSFRPHTSQKPRQRSSSAIVPKKDGKVVAMEVQSLRSVIQTSLLSTDTDDDGPTSPENDENTLFSEARQSPDVSLRTTSLQRFETAPQLPSLAVPNVQENTVDQNVLSGKCSASSLPSGSPASAQRCPAQRFSSRCSLSLPHGEGSASAPPTPAVPSSTVLTKHRRLCKPRAEIQEKQRHRMMLRHSRSVDEKGGALAMPLSSPDSRRTWPVGEKSRLHTVYCSPNGLEMGEVHPTSSPASSPIPPCPWLPDEVRQRDNQPLSL